MKQANNPPKNSDDQFAARATDRAKKYSSLNKWETFKTWEKTLAGGYDGANIGGECSGVKGMYKAGEKLDYAGDKLSYIPTPFTQFMGKILGVQADIITTIADFNNPDVSKEKAILNTTVKVVTYGIGEKIGKDIDEAGFREEKKYIYDQAGRKLLDEIKEEGTKPSDETKKD